MGARKWKRPERAKFLAEVGARVRAARERAGLTQAAVGTYVGVSRASIAMVETGRAGLLIDSLLDLAVALDVPVMSLVPNGDALPAPSPWKARALAAEAQLREIRRTLGGA